MKKNIIISLLIVLPLLSGCNDKNNNYEVVDTEPCLKNCKMGDRVILSDNTSWHIVSTNDKKTVLLSDANIGLDGNYYDVDITRNDNTGQYVYFDEINRRTTEKNPYCIYPDLGCAAYAKNNIDVFEDSSIKVLIDTKYLPRIKKYFGDDIIVRLLKHEEYLALNKLENNNFLYYSNYWLMTSKTPYSAYFIDAENRTISGMAAAISYRAGIRPVIEIETNLVYEQA